jgi:predicted alpha/beta superfamily hydrolase
MTMRFSKCWITLASSLALALSFSAHVAEAQTVVKPLVIGESLELLAKGLKETRRINVYLPDAYQADRNISFPVVYMPDGGLAEDFLHIAGLIQVSIANGSMRPFILVGIENTVRRRDLTGPSENALDREKVPNLGGSSRFRQFIADELIPEIDQRYRTTKERALVGESLAGLFTLECLLHTPDLFQSYVAIDPSLWWNDEALTAQFAEKLKTHPTLFKKLYFASSGQAGMENGAKGFSEMLKKSGVQDLQWTYQHYPKETHATVYHPAALIAFRQLFAPVSKTH